MKCRKSQVSLTDTSKMIEVKIDYDMMSFKIRKKSVIEVSYRKIIKIAVNHHFNKLKIDLLSLRFH
jgi:hypothetical protein